MCFKNNRRPWVWKLNWHGFDIERNIIWKSWFHKYIFNWLLSLSIHLWLFRKNDGWVQCNGHRDGTKKKKQWCKTPTTTTLLIVGPNYILIKKKKKKDISAFVKHRAGCPLSQFLEQFVKHIQNICSFCAFQGIFTPALRPNTYDVWQLISWT